MWVNLKSLSLRIFIIYRCKSEICGENRAKLMSTIDRSKVYIFFDCLLGI